MVSQTSCALQSILHDATRFFLTLVAIAHDRSPFDEDITCVCRDRALTAHQVAATKIMEQNNRGRDLNELDLHGLHAAEATAAIDAHITSMLHMRMTSFYDIH